MKPDDPASRGAAHAIAHLNDDHADALLNMVRALGGHPEATAAHCANADSRGLDLIASTPSSEVEVRVEYAQPIDTPQGLRQATVELAKRARATLAN